VGFLQGFSYEAISHTRYLIGRLFFTPPPGTHSIFPLCPTVVPNYTNLRNALLLIFAAFASFWELTLRNPAG